MPAPIQVEGPFYPPMKQRFLNTLHWVAIWIAVVAFTVGAASAIALSLQF